MGRNATCATRSAGPGHDDHRGRRQVHHRAQIRLATADMLWDRGLVPPAPLPGNPMLHAQHAAGASR